MWKTCWGYQQLSAVMYMCEGIINTTRDSRPSPFRFVQDFILYGREPTSADTTYLWTISYKLPFYIWYQEWFFRVWSNFGCIYCVQITDLNFSWFWQKSADCIHTCHDLMTGVLVCHLNNVCVAIPYMNINIMHWRQRRLSKYYLIAEVYWLFKFINTSLTI